MDVIITTPDEIRAIFNDCLANVNLISKPEPQRAPEIEKPISQAEAIAFLGKSRQAFYSWRRKGLITAHILGGRVWYFKSELIAAMK